jgi:hypothetical protein
MSGAQVQECRPPAAVTWDTQFGDPLVRFHVDNSSDALRAPAVGSQCHAPCLVFALGVVDSVAAPKTDNPTCGSWEAYHQQLVRELAAGTASAALAPG